jgi:peptide/nickel transport system substrate-binding protein
MVGKKNIIATLIITLVLAFSVLLVPLNSGGMSNNSFVAQVTGSGGNSNSTFYLAVDSYGTFDANLNPFSTSALEPYGYTALSLVFSPLMYLMNGENPQPGLATSYSYAANLTAITFHLRSGVEYSNGQSFNASDVIFTFNYIMSHSSIDSQGISSFVKSISSTGNTVTFYLDNTAYTDLYSIMTQPILYPGQWNNITNPATDTITNPIGTGPFIASSISTSEFQFTWNSHYYYTGPHLSKIVMQSYPTVTAETNALVSGNINWLSGAFDADAPAWASQNTSHFYFSPPSGFLMLQLNTNMWPLNNANFRSAIAYVFDRQALSNESLQPPAGNYVIPALNNYLTPSFLNKYPNGTVYSLNLTKATDLMEAAGYHMSNGKWVAANGTQPSITLSGNGAAANVVANLNTMVTELTDFGIKATTYLPSGAIFYSNLYQGNYSAGYGFIASSIDPIGALNVSFSGFWHAPIGQTAKGDYSRFVNNSLTQNITLAAAEPTLAKQQPYIQNALSILINETPAIPVAETVSQNEFNIAGFSGINQTSFKDALYSNTFGPVVSIAVPLVGVHFTSSSPPVTSITPTDYAIIGVIVAVVVIGAVVGVTRKNKKED